MLVFKHMCSYLFQTFAEGVELSKDVHLRKLKGSLFGVSFNLLLGLVERVTVLSVERDALPQLLHDHRARVIPHSRQSVVGDVRLARLHHLIGHLKYINTKNEQLPAKQ